MRAALEERLWSHWPEIMRGRGKPVSESLMGWGCSHGDGWYAILDALCEVLTAHAGATSRQPPEAMQIKEKFGGLRFYASGADDYDWGAIHLAEVYSYRVCEVSGAPGRLCLHGGYLYGTRSPAVAASDGFVPTRTDERRPIAPVPDAGRVLAARWPGVLMAEPQVPDGWFDLVDALLDRLSQEVQREGSAGPCRVRLGCEDSRLVIRLEGALTPIIAGMAAYATAVSRHVQPDTGALRVP